MDPLPQPGTRTRATDPEHALVDRLRAGDEQAFAELVDRLHPMLRRIARGYVHTEEAAGDVVQETWIAVLRGIDRFEGRSSLRTWVVSIMVNIARRQGVRDARTVPFSALAPEGDDRTFPAQRFAGPDDEYPGHWTLAPERWRDPAAAALAGETRRLLRAAVDSLPDTQRAVLTLRDVEGWSGPEVAATLGLTEGNQRVLLHRARAAVRHVLDDYLTMDRHEHAPRVEGAR